MDRPKGRLLDLKGAAQYMDDTERHVRELWQSRRLAGVKVGRKVRFDLRDLDEFIERNRVGAVDR